MSTTTCSHGTLPVKVTSKQKNGQETWEGSLTVPGLQAAKLVRKQDNSTSFGTRAAVLNSARSVATKLGYAGVEVQEQRKAAKTAPKTASKTASKAKAKKTTKSA
jgi:hypothetical protein